jgi:hypothetical protein
VLKIPSIDSVQATDKRMQQGYNVLIGASLDGPSTNADMDGTHRSRDPIRGPIHTHVIPATGHREGSQTDVQTMDTSLLVNKVASTFRDTLGGLVNILEGAGQDDEEIMTPYRSLQSSQPLGPSVSSSSSLTQPDTSSIGELLDEIKGLKRQMKMNADRRIEKDAADIQRLRAQMNDLHRTISHCDSRRQISSDVVMNAPKALNPSCSRRDRATLTQLRHPLAHLLMGVDNPPSESCPSSSIAVDAEVPSTFTSGTLPLRKDRRPPLPTGTSSLFQNSVPQDDVPLPVKSQRKHRMFFPDHQQLTI